MRHNSQKVRTIREYPESLKLFRIPASKYWYVQMYMKGGSLSGVKKSTKCEKFDGVVNFAINWCEERLIEKREYQLRG